MSLMREVKWENAPVEFVCCCLLFQFCEQNLNLGDSVTECLERLAGKARNSFHIDNDF